jgi:hypothetical protein
VFRVELLGPLPGEMHEPAPHQQETLFHYHLLHCERRELSDSKINKKNLIPAKKIIIKINNLSQTGKKIK